MTLAERLHQAKWGRTLAPLTLVAAATVSVSAAHAQTPVATMSVLTPKQNERLGTTRFNLDVRFKTITDSPVVTAELWVDGVRWVHQDLDAPRKASTLSFLVDGSTLSAGAHTIVVKVLNAAGDVSSAKVNVVAGSDDAASETTASYGAPEVRFLTPGNGKKIVGTVELLVDAKGRNGSDAWVAFRVDDVFRVMINRPPYSFAWDTTKETNGVHTLTAIGSLDSSNATTTRTINVVVNNPGGFTKRASEIPDLSAPRKTATPVAAKALTIPLPKATPAATTVVKPTGNAQVAENAAPALPAANALGMDTSAAPVSAAKIAAPRVAVPTVPTFAPIVAAKPMPVLVASRVAPVSADAVPTGTAEPTVSDTQTELVPVATFAELDALPTAAHKTVSLAPRLSRPAMPVAATKAVKVVAHTSVAAPMRSVTIPMGTPVAKAKRITLSTSVAIAKPVVRGGVPKAVMVAFDGDRIAFDVAPRVEAGMPIAPFRQIFEHTGGKVSWANDTKTMRAVNADREIVVGIGDTSATVNGEKVSLSRAASLDRGRTIVPLNFVGKALDVDVKYDPVTGRMTITSKN